MYDNCIDKVVTGVVAYKAVMLVNEKWRNDDLVEVIRAYVFTNLMYCGIDSTEIAKAFDACEDVEVAAYELLMGKFFCENEWTLYRYIRVAMMNKDLTPYAAVEQFALKYTNEYIIELNKFHVGRIWYKLFHRAGFTKDAESNVIAVTMSSVIKN